MLNTRPNITAVDDFYQELIDLHRDLSDDQSAVVNAKLILLLANQIGDLDVLREAMRAAREDVDALRESGGGT
jgi:GTP1/Obg family GTP-binding protein